MNDPLMLNTFTTCRICLIVDSKLYEMNILIKDIYRRLLGAEMIYDDRLPKYICFECVALLYKSFKFIKRCLHGQNILFDILNRSEALFEEAVRSIDRKASNLQSSLCYWENSNKILIINEIHTDSESNKFYNKEDSNENLEYSVKHKRKEETISNISIEPIDDEFSERNMDTSDIDENVSLKSESHNIKIEIGTTPHNNFKGTSYVSQTLDSDKKKTKHVKKPKFKKYKAIVTKSIDCDEESMNDNKIIVKNYDSYEPKMEEVIEEKDKMLNGKKPKTKLKETEKKINMKSKEPKIKFLKQRMRARPIDPKIWTEIFLTPEEQKTEWEARKQSANYVKSPYPCSLCLRGFLDADSFVAHKKRHATKGNPFECSLCLSRFPFESRLKVHTKYHTIRFKCNLCDYITYNKGNLRQHEAFHSGVVYRCEQCDLTFKKQSSWRTHLRLRHRSEFVCARCGDNFVNLDGLQMHTSRMHAADAPQDNADGEGEEASRHHCEKCAMWFYSEHAYRKHFLTSIRHEGESAGVHRQQRAHKPAGAASARRAPPARLNTACTPCGLQFRSEGECVRHHRAAHAGTQMPEPYMCEVCGVTRARHSALAHHLRTHAPRQHPCQLCSARFASAAALRRHGNVHSGARPYPCPHPACPKRFTQPGSATVHHRTVHLKQPLKPRARRRGAPHTAPAPPPPADFLPLAHTY